MNKLNLCQYQDILGKPNEGIHQYRFLGFALFDILGTIFLIVLIHLLTKINYIYITIFMVVLFIFLHWLFCVNTRLNELLFGKIN
jgi:uncharacterized membrane protein YcaP (DUF421 family)